ncbi:nicotinate-nucleotide adenylyltransferase [Desulfovibrio inopinatus]|uniref:nicotinate-nucleotide adenylyltransferase n=1 Tax=Desulfovibrio inopinatus TaxID=102109 RepID=UPI0003FA6424|nr:nicotinate-nucleotide adenylyltransferase [Desulfovibrio inopinatus]
MRSQSGASGDTVYRLGVIHGRFQVFHNDHLRYVLAGKQLCDHLVVGITNPDPGLTGHDTADPKRSRAESNPLTYYERQWLVRVSLLEAGVNGNAFTVTPFPVNSPELYLYYVPLDAVFFLTIYDDWGRRKRELFTSLGLDIHVLWECSPQDKGLSGTDVRRAMAEGNDWESQVPAAAVSLLRQWKIPERLAGLSIV